MMEYHFADQVAVITGGSRGLGQAFAQALAQAGATVVLVARSEAQLQDAAQAIERADGFRLLCQQDGHHPPYRKPRA